jgi:voltage-gated potassium channel
MKDSSSETKPDTLTAFQCFLLVLSIYVLGALFYQTAFKPPATTSQLLDRIDTIVCLIFMWDFFFRLYQAPSKLTFLKWGWVDFVSSIPMLDIFRWGRVIRVVRVFRLLRAFRGTKELMKFFFRNRAEGTLASVAIISMLLTIFCSIAVLNFEDGSDSNIKSPSDALWWAWSTVTTVGYGDKYPTTTEGRIIAAILMTAGVGLFGTFTGLVAGLFVKEGQKEEESELAELISEVRLLRKKIDSLEESRANPL